MRILSMTATFGKLDHQTLTLKPGLNIIQAPNEWGKSTWCAFLAAMLYGIDTSQRTTQTALADKEHYAPWSGLPMSGRLDIFWRGKEITIERSTKGRIPMGEFRAYETDSGLSVPELTADNCGQQLLGVERSVFLRAGFIRQSDMPVTQDEALRRRLNALVTTGDENDAGDLLAKKLKELKNSCRHNKTGAIPQAESKKALLTESLSKLSALRTQSEQIGRQRQQLEARLTDLQNHQASLEYDNAQEGLYRLTMAQAARTQADSQAAQLLAQTDGLLPRQEASQRLEKLGALMGEKAVLERQILPDIPIPAAFSGLSPEEAVQQARSDKADYDKALRPGPILLPVFSLFLFLAGIGTGLLLSSFAFLLLLPAVILFGIGFHKGKQKRQAQAKILFRYDPLPPENWISTAEAYQQQASVSQTHRAQLSAWSEKLQNLTGGLSPEAATEKWQHGIALHDKLEKALEAARQAALREADLKAAVKPIPPPSQPDKLTLSGEETAAQIAQITGHLQQLQLQAGQCMGQIEALGQEDVLQHQLDAITQRIEKLQDIYEATVLALAHLEQAALQLQQRFAPQLTAKARELFAALTGGRYDRLILDQQLQLQAGAAPENSLHTARWRSDGTIDQLYLALRLAVAGELTPQAPLILDDVLVRFDDTRHAAAMELLLQQATDKQILLFTCQSREGTYSPERIIEI